MDWLVFIVQWLHVILGILWFGAALYGDFILIPALNTLPLTTQRAVGAAIGARGNPIIISAAAGVIVLGVLRGTVFGPIKSLDALGTAYGITWLVALVLAIGLFLVSLRVLAPRLERLADIPESEALNPDGSPSPALAAAVERVKRALLIELVLFFAIFTCMILMRFGL